MCEYAPWTCSAHEDQNREVDPLQLEFGMVVSGHGHVGTRTFLQPPNLMSVRWKLLGRFLGSLLSPLILPLCRQSLLIAPQ